MKKVKIVVLTLLLLLGFFIPYVYSVISGNFAVSMVDSTNALRFYTMIGDTTNGLWVNIKAGVLTSITNPVTVIQPTQANLLATVYQPTATNLNMTAAQPTASLLNMTATQGTAAAIAGGWPVKVTDGTNTSAVLTRGTKLNDAALAVRPIYNRSQLGAFGSLMIAQETPEVFVSFPYTLNTRQISIVTNLTGTVTQANSMAQLQTGTNVAGSSTIQSLSAVRYTPGQGVVGRFTAIFSACVANSTQEVGVGDANDGFFFSCNGATFSVNQRKNGSNNYVAQSSWNGDDKLNGAGPSGVTIDKTKGNVYIIQYQWLGFGAINFFIETPNGDKALVHTIQYSNANTTPSTFSGNLPIWSKVINSGNNTNLSMYITSLGLYTEGPRSVVGVNNAFTVSLAAITNTDTNVFTLQNRTTLNSITNRTRIRLQSLSIRNSNSTADAVCKIIHAGTEGGSPSFTNISTANSIAAIDTAGTTVTGGDLINSFSIQNGESFNFDLTLYNYRIDPGDTFNFVCASESGTNVTIRYGVSWLEEF